MTAGLSLTSLHCLVVQCSVRHLSECDFPRGITASKITYIDLFHYFQPDAKWRKTQRRRRESAARRSLAAAIPEALEVRGLLNPVWEKSLSPLQTFHGKCSATPYIFQHCNCRKCPLVMFISYLMIIRYSRVTPNGLALCQNLELFYWFFFAGMSSKGMNGKTSNFHPIFKFTSSL